MYKVGQLVYVKPVDELVAKYGRNQFGIATPYMYILHDMERFCGQEYVIQDTCFDCVYILNNADRYLWSEEALEPINKQNPEDICDWSTVFEV